MISQSVMVHQA